MNRKDMLAKAAKMAEEAKAFLTKEDLDAQDAEQRDKLILDAKRWYNRAADLAEVETIAAGYKTAQNEKPAVAKFEKAGQFLVAVKSYYDRRGPVHPALIGGEWDDPDDGDAESVAWLKTGNVSVQRKDLVESVGASGGFLVPVEFRPELMGVVYEGNPIRDRATVIPMRRRQLNMPVLDQTGTGAGSTRQHGGIVATWTEEAAQKDETEPQFRQIELVAHKLVCYTEASDELLADEAIGLTAFLNGPMGFGGAIRWEEEFTFLQGTGGGQPLGVIPANATITIVRATANTIALPDIVNMVVAHHGDDPVWHISRSAMAQLIQLNGPAGNPSYVFIPNARDGIPATLFGFPVMWTEKLPALGTTGDLLLADWSFYLIGDRQATTIATSTEFRFRNDLTAWRAVHRVDGKPWLSQPITLQDGTTQISPFVILGSAAS